MGRYDHLTFEKSVKKQFSLENKIAVITGGGGFLGRHFADALGEFGAKCILLDVFEEGLKKNQESLEASGVTIETHLVDLVNKDDVKAKVEKIVSENGTIDILINGAAFAMKNLQDGGDKFFEKIEDYDPELWQLSNNINLNGNFLITQQVGKIMKQQKSGSIINIASDVGVISPDHRIYQKNPQYDYEGVEFNTPISYSTSKAGIISMTKYLATYWAKDGIRVNSISPAGVYREQDDKFVEQLENCIPMGRMANALELKGAVAFLASSASSFITGHNLMVDGGRTAW